MTESLQKPNIEKPFKSSILRAPMTNPTPGGTNDRKSSIPIFAQETKSAK